MNINTKLMVALGILCAFVIISGVLGLVFTRAIDDKLNIVTTTTTPLVETIDDMIITLLQMNSIVSDISAQQDPTQIAALSKQLQAIQKNFQKLEVIAFNLLSEDSLKEKLNTAIKKEQVFYDTTQKIISLKGSSQSSIKDLKEQINSQASDASNILEEISIRAYASNKNANAESFKAVKSTVFFLSLTTILSLVSAIVIGIYLSRSLIRPINALSDAASKLSVGNFEVSVAEPSTDDEISQLTAIFNKMVKSLQKLIEESPGLKKYIDLSVQKRNLAEQEYKLTQKSVYLVKDRTPHRAYDIVSDKINKGVPGLCVTREDPELIKEKNYFSQKEGGIICQDCFPREGHVCEIQPETIKILRIILEKDWPTLLKLKFEAQYLKELSLCEKL